MSSIKTKLVLTKVITILVAVIFLGSLGYRMMVGALMEVQQEKLESIAGSTARDLGRHLEELKTALQRIRTAGHDPERAAHLLPQNSLAFPLIVWIDEAGNERGKLVRGQPDARRRSWGDSPFFLSIEPGRLFISSVMSCPELAEPVVYFALAGPSPPGDKAETVLAALPLSTIAQRLEETRVGRTGFVGLVSADGTILAHENRAHVSKRIEPLTPEDHRIRRDLLALRAAFARTHLLGIDSFSAFSPVPGVRWEVAASLPDREFMAYPNRLKLFSLLSCTLILAAGILISLLFARRLTRSIDQITRHTEYVSNGDFTRALKISSGDELESLARSFNAMTDRLRRTTVAKEGLHNILQSILDPLVIAGGDGLITGANASAVKFLGYSEETLRGMPLAALFPEGEPIFRGVGFQRVLESGPIRNYETQVLTREGDAVPVLFSCSLTSPEEDGRTGMVGILKDISERRSAELARLRALREAEEARDKIDAILKSVTDGLVVTDVERRIILMNPAAEELLGTPLVEAWQQPIAAVIGEKTLREHLLAQMVGDKISSPVDLEIFDHRRQEMRVFQTRTSPVESRDRVITGLITVLRDVTHERQIDRLKNEFISTAAHELRTPLTSIMGYSEFLLYSEEFGGFDPEQQREFLAEIFEKADLLSKIVNELLDISRIESGQAMPLDRTRCRLGETVSRAVRTFRPHCPEHRFEVNVAERDAEIWVDQGKFVQALENLLSNAVKYSPGGGLVRVSAMIEEDLIHISVEDRGIGMTQEQAGRIFDKFYRADSSNTAIGGLGLGMSIVKSIVAAHGGTIGVESAPGSGTTIHLTLPTGRNLSFTDSEIPTPFPLSMGA